jgi:hypothetical protein
MKVNQRGASFLEMPLSLIVILGLMLGILDLIRIGYTKCMIRVALTESIKKSQGNIDLIADVWSLPSGDYRVKDFFLARENVLKFADSRIKFGMLPGVRVIPVSHFDATTDSETQFRSSVAFLPPGYSGSIPNWDVPIHNPNKCSPNHVSNATDNENDALFQSCTGAKVRQAGEKLTDLIEKYPTVMAAFVEMDTLFFGKQSINIQVAGFQQIQSAYLSPPTATPTSNLDSPGDDGDISNPACENKVKSAWCFGKNAYDLTAFLRKLFDPKFMGKDNYDYVKVWLTENDSEGFIVDPKNIVQANGDICYPIHELLVNLFYTCEEIDSCEFKCTRGLIGCFDKDTDITLADGTFKKIQNINAFDKIKNPSTGEVQEIKHLIVGSEKEALLEISVASTTIRVTQKHPFLTERGLLFAKELTVNDKVMLKNSSFESIKSIKTLPIDPNQLVYNIEVDTMSDNAKERLLTTGEIVTPDFAIQKTLQQLRN